MSEIEQYAIIKGKVVDSNGKSLPNVTVTISVSPENIKSSNTNKDGEYSFTFPATDIKNIQLNYFLEKYTTKSISSVYQTSETKTEQVYEVPRITLSLLPDPTQQLTSQVNQDLNKQENNIAKQQLNIPTEAKLANLFNNKKETIKSTLIPFIIKLILEFGTTAAQDIINKKTPQSFNCPSSAKIKELIKKRNKLVKQLNNIYSSITILTKILGVTNTIISALKIGIQLVYAIPYPATGIPVIGLPPLTSGIIEVTGTAKDKLIQNLTKAGIIVSILTITSATIGVLLGTIIQILNQLDILLSQCAVDQNMDLEQLNNEINSLSNPTVETTQNPEGDTYKGFKLEIVTNEKNTSKYIQRYAQALTKQGVPVLKTEPSFASDPQVLIDQLKFIIDSNPNITAE
jgi:hypothetical protein